MKETKEEKAARIVAEVACKCPGCKKLPAADPKYGFDLSRVHGVLCLGCKKAIGYGRYWIDPGMARFGSMMFFHENCMPEKPNKVNKIELREPFIHQPPAALSFDGEDRDPSRFPPLFIPLKTKYFEMFKLRIKDTEWRRYGPRWNERTCFAGRGAVLSRGYGRHARLGGVVEGIEVTKDPPATVREVFKEGGFFIGIKIKLWEFQ